MKVEISYSEHPGPMRGRWVVITHQNGIILDDYDTCAAAVAAYPGALMTATAVLILIEKFRAIDRAAFQGEGGSMNILDYYPPSNTNKPWQVYSPSECSPIGSFATFAEAELRFPQATLTVRAVWQFFNERREER